jgi:pimeloyl-ACP methyl ester carboxylesterase
MPEQSQPHPDEERFNREYTALEADKAEQRAQFAAHLDPQPETEQFAEEMSHEQLVEDPETGLKLGVYELNRGKTGRPVVLHLPWSVSAASGVGRGDLNILAQHIDRPVVVIDIEGMGSSDAIPGKVTFDDLAAAHLRVIDQIGIDEFDLAGFSMGGVMSARLAVAAGDRVKRLVTVSSPGFADEGFLSFAKHFAMDEGKFAKTYMAEAGEAVQRDMGDSGAGSYVGPRNYRGIKALLGYAAQMSKPVLADLAEHLSPKTQWVDIVGSKEAISDYADHLAVVRERNEKTPHSSQSHILGSETHSWGVHRAGVAEAISISLDK